MSIETLNTVNLLAGLTTGSEQGVLTNSTESPESIAFTATLQTQVQRLNEGLTLPEQAIKPETNALQAQQPEVKPVVTVNSPATLRDVETSPVTLQVTSTRDSPLPMLDLPLTTPAIMITAKPQTESSLAGLTVKPSVQAPSQDNVTELPAEIKQPIQMPTAIMPPKVETKPDQTFSEIDQLPVRLTVIGASPLILNEGGKADKVKLQSVTPNLPGSQPAVVGHTPDLPNSSELMVSAIHEQSFPDLNITEQLATTSTVTLSDRSEAVIAEYAPIVFTTPEVIEAAAYPVAMNVPETPVQTARPAVLSIAVSNNTDTNVISATSEYSKLNPVLQPSTILPQSKGDNLSAQAPGLLVAMGESSANKAVAEFVVANMAIQLDTTLSPSTELPDNFQQPLLKESGQQQPPVSVATDQNAPNNPVVLNTLGQVDTIPNAGVEGASTLQHSFKESRQQHLVSVAAGQASLVESAPPTTVLLPPGKEYGYAFDEVLMSSHTVEQIAGNSILSPKKLNKDKELGETLVEAVTSLLPMQTDQLNPVSAVVSPVASQPQQPLSELVAASATPIIMGQEAVNPQFVTVNQVASDRITPEIPTVSHDLSAVVTGNVMALSSSAPNPITSMAALPHEAVLSTPSSEAAAQQALNNLLGLEAGQLSKTATPSSLEKLTPTGLSDLPLNINPSNPIPSFLEGLNSFGLGRPLSDTAKVEVPSMAAHIYSPDWDQELGAKILWMTRQNMSSVELNLNPKHLGPISIHIDMQQDQASIAFTTQNANIKEIIEASLPKLRELLQGQQLNLTEVNVSQQAFSGQSQGQTQSPFFGQNAEGRKPSAEVLENGREPAVPIDESAEQIEQSRALVSKGLVSVYV